MFCLDFAFAFFVHAACIKWSKSEEHLLQSFKSSKFLYTFGFGSVAGVGSAVALYPFDIVRMTVLEKGNNHFAFSTIPYMTFYLGTYFALRKRSDTFSTKFAYATGASLGAAVVEFPFDKAKLSIAQTKNMALLTTGMRIPLAALLLVSYDQILLSKFVRMGGDKCE